MVSVNSKTQTFTNGTPNDAGPVDSEFTSAFNNDAALASATTAIENGSIINATTLTINSAYAGGSPGNMSYMVERGSLANTGLRWNETKAYWELTNDGTNYHPLIPVLSADPGAPIEGDIWYNSTDHKLRFKNNSATIIVPGVLDDLSDVTITSASNRQTVRYNGTAWVNGQDGYALIEAKTASASASINFTTDITSAYDVYELEIVDLVSNTDQIDVLFRVSEDAGSSWKSGSSDYQWSVITKEMAVSSVGNTGSAADTSINLTGGSSQYPLGNASGEAYSGTIVIYNPAGSRNKRITWKSNHDYYSSGNGVETTGSGKYKGTTNAITGFRVILGGSATITSGSFYLRAKRKS